MRPVVFGVLSIIILIGFDKSLDPPGLLTLTFGFAFLISVFYLIKSTIYQEK